MKKDLILDIETVPKFDPNERAKTVVIEPPAHYKKEDAIARYIDEKRETIVSDIIKTASLNPIYGKVVSVAMRYNGEIYSCCSEVESTVLGYIDGFLDELVSWEETRLITFNGKAFDVPFVNIRAKHELLPNTTKYDQKIHFDVYLYLTNFGSFSGGVLGMSQSAVAGALSVHLHGGTGADVYEWYAEKKLNKIQAYNEADVLQLEDICRELGILNATEEMPF